MLGHRQVIGRSLHIVCFFLFYFILWRLSEDVQKGTDWFWGEINILQVLNMSQQAYS